MFIMTVAYMGAGASLRNLVIHIVSHRTVSWSDLSLFILLLVAGIYFTLVLIGLTLDGSRTVTYV